MSIILESYLNESFFNKEKTFYIYSMKQLPKNINLKDVPLYKSKSGVYDYIEKNNAKYKEIFEYKCDIKKEDIKKHLIKKDKKETFIDIKSNIEFIESCVQVTYENEIYILYYSDLKRIASMYKEYKDDLENEEIRNVLDFECTEPLLWVKNLNKLPTKWKIEFNKIIKNK